jgi:hypothetical protein
MGVCGFRFGAMTLWGRVAEGSPEGQAVEIVALDGTKLLALMVAGGTFALAGLWLMFRPQAEGEAARIELFGLKFQASSAGLLVFLIGAVFLAVPIFVPEKPSVTGAAGNAPLPPTGTESGTAQIREADPRQTATLLPAGPDVEEQEPNDTISTANVLGLGQTVRASLAPGDVDWYAFSTENEDVKSFRVTFRNLSDGCPSYAVLNAVETRVTGAQVCMSDISSSRTTFVDGPRYFVRVDAQRYRTDYELAISAE